MPSDVSSVIDRPLRRPTSPDDVPASETSSIPLVDLRAQYQSIAAELDDAIRGCLSRADFILGDDVSAFEREFAAFCEVRHCVGVGSGTDALHLACRALGIGPSDEVIIPAFTFVATAAGVCLAGAKPVLVDVDRDTATLDPECLGQAVTSKTKAIIPVHLYGQCAEMESISAWARERGLHVIEDAAQAHGAGYQRRKAGALGDVACFSFYPGKNLGAYGDAGCLTTDSEALAERLQSLRNWGAIQKYHHQHLGFNSRLDTIQAAILRVKLKHLVGWNEARSRIASRYTELLGRRSELTTPIVAPGRKHVFHLYVVRCADRDARLRRLNDRGIAAALHYPLPVHLLPAYQWLGYTRGAFPNAEAHAATCLSLPLYPELTDAQVAWIVEQL